MPRTLTYPSAGSTVTNKIIDEHGGTNVDNKASVLSKYNVLPKAVINTASGVAGLDENKLLPLSLFKEGSAGGDYPKVNYWDYIYPNAVVNLEITNYDANTAYTVKNGEGSASTVAMTANGDIALTVGPTPGTDFFYLNGRKITFEIQNAGFTTSKMFLRGGPYTGRAVMVLPIPVPFGSEDLSNIQYASFEYADSLDKLSTNSTVGTPTGTNDVYPGSFVSDGVEFILSNSQANTTYYVHGRYTSSKTGNGKWTDPVAVNIIDPPPFALETASWAPDAYGPGNYFGFSLGSASSGKIFIAGQPNNKSSREPQRAMAMIFQIDENGNINNSSNFGSEDGKQFQRFGYAVGFGFALNTDGVSSDNPLLNLPLRDAYVTEPQYGYVAKFDDDGVGTPTPGTSDFGNGRLNVFKQASEYYYVNPVFNYGITNTQFSVGANYCLGMSMGVAKVNNGDLVFVGGYNLPNSDTNCKYGVMVATPDSTGKLSFTTALPVSDLYTLGASVNTGVAKPSSYGFAISAVTKDNGIYALVSDPDIPSTTDGLSGDQANGSGTVVIVGADAGTGANIAAKQLIKRPDNTATKKYLNFGYSVATSRSGKAETIAVIGAPGSITEKASTGAAFVYGIVLANGTYTVTLKATLLPQNDSPNRFGHAVGVSFDGKWLLIGAPGDSPDSKTTISQFDLYTLNNDTQVYEYTTSTVHSNGDGLGSAIAMAADDSAAAIGAPAAWSDYGGGNVNNGRVFFYL